MPSVHIPPAERLSGTLRVPSDKSLTHRALLLAAISDRAVRIDAPLVSADTEATAAAVAACGARIDGRLADGQVTVHGRGPRGLTPPARIDCQNAGTLMRLLPGILAGQRFERVTIDGDDSLRRRPMRRIGEPLAAVGVALDMQPDGTPPLTLHGGAAPRPHEHHLTVASAQVKSCLLLAGLWAEGETWVNEPLPSRDHTERMLAAAGVDLLRRPGAVGVRGPIAHLALPDVRIPADPSSAAAHLAAAALRAEPTVTFADLNLNPGRVGLLAVLERMGVGIQITPGPAVAGEPCGTVTVTRATRLVGTEIGAAEVPAMIDELPLVALLGAFAEGSTTVHGAAELRVKESDRISTVVAALRTLGADAEEHPDGFTVHGRGSLAGGSMDSHGDHRLAMLGAVAGLLSDTGVSVHNMDAVSVSYPGFLADLAALGAPSRPVGA